MHPEDAGTSEKTHLIDRDLTRDGRPSAKPVDVPWPLGDRVKNLRIFATLVNGEQLELQDCPTGRDLVRALLHQSRTPAKALVIEASDKDGRIVRIVVPADDSETAKVSIAQES